MTEWITPEATEHSDRYKTLIIVLTLITTVFTALVAALQADANIRANIANRDSQYYAVLLSGELRRSGLQSGYDFDTLTAVLSETQTALLMGFMSLQSEADGDELGVEINKLAELAAQTRADKLTSFSVFYTDPRYAPKTPEDMPNAQEYLKESNALANELLQKQNDASDAYHQWSNKSDSYVAVLTVIAVAFFLFGLAQTLTGRMRLVFAIFGGVILLSSTAWAMLILIR